MKKAKNIELEHIIDSLEKAINAAYHGSSENGSFIRGTHIEYVPNIYVTLHRLKMIIFSEEDAI